MASKSPSKTVRPDTPSRKPAWNSLQNDLSVYKLSKDELLKKKQLMMSKNSIFYSPSSNRKTKSKETVKTPSSSALDLIEDGSNDEGVSTASLYSVKREHSVKNSIAKNDEISLKKTKNKNSNRVDSTQHESNLFSSNLFSDIDRDSDVDSKKKKRWSPKSTDAISATDMDEIVTHIQSLREEMLCFEQLSGRKSSMHVSNRLHFNDFFYVCNTYVCLLQRV